MYVEETNKHGGVLIPVEYTIIPLNSLSFQEGFVKSGTKKAENHFHS